MLSDYLLSFPRCSWECLDRFGDHSITLTYEFPFFIRLRRWFSLHFFTKTKQKIVVAPETRRENLQVCKFHCLQGRSPQQGTLCVIKGQQGPELLVRSEELEIGE